MRIASRTASSIAQVCAAALAVGLGCTHTVDGTGSSTSSGASGTSSSGTASSSGTSGSVACPSIAGTWQVTEPAILTGPPCESDGCILTQTDCNITLTCGTGTYDGTLFADATGATLNWTGAEDAACSASFGPNARNAEGSCTPTFGSACFFIAKKD